MVWTPPETSLPYSVCNINYSNGGESEKLEGASYAEQREKSANKKQKWGKSESMWVSAQLPQSCRILPKRPISMSLHKEYGIMTGGGRQRQGAAVQQIGLSEDIKRTQILLTAPQTLPRSPPLSCWRHITLRSPQLTHGPQTPFVSLTHTPTLWLATWAHSHWQ